MADQLRMTHRNSEAAEAYKTYLARKPNDPAGYTWRGTERFGNGRRGPGDPLPRPSNGNGAPRSCGAGPRAWAEVVRGRPEAALGYLDRAVKIDPFDLGNREQRMRLVALLGKKAEADAEGAKWSKSARIRAVSTSSIANFSATPWTCDFVVRLPAG